MTTTPAWFWPALCMWMWAAWFTALTFALRPPRAAAPTSIPAAPEEGTR